MNWVATILGSGGLLTAIVTAIVMWRRLPAERGLTEAQRQQTMVATAEAAARIVRAELDDCRSECTALRRRVAMLEAHVQALERILRAAGLPIPIMGGGE